MLRPNNLGIKGYIPRHLAAVAARLKLSMSTSGADAADRYPMRQPPGRNHRERVRIS
jgi:hypothetical protein